MKKAILLIIVSVLSGCKLSPDWSSVSYTADDASDNKVVWLEAMTAKEDRTLIASEVIQTSPKRNVDVVLTEVTDQGVTVFQKHYDFGPNEAVVDLISHASMDVLLVNTTDKKSHVVALIDGNIVWQYAFTSGEARSVIAEAGRIVVTGERTVALNLNGDLLWQKSHTQPMWSVALGLWGEVYLGGNSGVYAYNQEGDMQWFWPTSQDNLSFQSAVAWQNGIVYHAVHDSKGEKLWVKSIDALSGLVFWEKEIVFESYHSLVAPFQMDITEQGDVMLVQSDRYSRQINRVNTSGNVEMVVLNSYGEVHDLALLPFGEWVVTGNGVTEKYDEKGEQIFWAKTDGAAQSTSGEIAILDGAIVIGQSAYVDGEIKGTLDGFLD